MPETCDLNTAAVELARIAGPLRRALTKATQSAGDLPDIPEAQIEVLRLLVERGPLSSADIAERLRLARPTVSNLLKAMSQAELVNRLATQDLRSTLLDASPRARRLLSQYDETSARVIAEALGTLTPDEQRRLFDAASPLRALTHALLPPTGLAESP